MPYLTTTGGLNFQYPTDGTQNWGSTLKTSFNTISAHNHTGAPNGAQLGTNALQANAVTEPKIRLTNNAYLRGRNAADSADVNILKVNASDALEFGNGTSNLTLSAANITLSGSGTIGSSGPFVFPLGAVGTPSVTFTGDLNTGIYSSGADTVDIATNGVQRVSVSTSATTSTLPVVHPLGAVGTPSVTFTGDLNTGIYSSGADTVDIATNGVQRVSVSTSATTSTLPVVHPLGAVGTPSMTFTGDLNTGIYSSGADTVDIATNGVQRVSVSTSATTSTLPLVAPLGAVGTPSYTFTGDLNTGVYSSGADTVDIATNGVQRVSVSTSATTSTLPLVAPLGAVGTPSYTFTGDLNTGIYSSGADALGLVTGGTERIRIDSSGNIGAGTTSPKDRIQVGTITAISPTNSAGANGSIFGFNHYYSSGSKAIVTGNRTVTVELSNDGGYLKSTTGTQTADSALSGMNDYVRWGGSNDNIVFYTGNTQRALIDSSGRLGIGTAASYQLHLSTDSAAKPTTNTWTIVSDERVKTNIQNYTKGLSEILQVRPITYDYNGLGGLPKGPGGISIVAQELQSVLPECVGFYDGYLDPADEEPTKIFNYNGHAMTFVLINAIKELHTRIAALEAQP